MFLLYRWVHVKVIRWVRFLNDLGNILIRNIFFEKNASGVEGSIDIQRIVCDHHMDHTRMYEVI